MALVAARRLENASPGKEQNEMLTSREREILQLLADGMSNADVAAAWAERSLYSAMLKPPTLTARLSGRSRAPLQAGHGCSAM